MGLGSQIFFLSGLAMGASAYNVPSNNVWSQLDNLNLTSDPTAACDFFKQNYPSMKILPTDANYTSENEGKLLFL